MKRIAVISLFVASAFLTLGAVMYGQAAHPMPAGQVGSFQILTGRYAIAGIGAAGADVESTAIFRIDTRTGQTTIYMTGTDKNGRTYGGWQPIPEAITYMK